MRILAALAALGGAVLIADSTLAQNTIRYVDPSLPLDLCNPSSGFDWATAFPTLECALDPTVNTAIMNFQNVELRLKQGTYKPDGTKFYPPGSSVVREAAFVVPSGVVAIRGKWAGDEGPDDDPGGSATILSGDIGVSGDMSDNCYHVLVFDENSISEPKLEGVIVEKGNADFVPALPVLPNPQINNCFGAGILIDGPRVTCTDVRVRDCFAQVGGGIGVREGLNSGAGGDLRGRRLTIRDNLAGLDGAGIYIDGGARGVIGNSTFRGNLSSRDGGGLFVATNVLDFEVNNSRMFDNSASARGGAAFLAAQTGVPLSTVSFINCTVAFNSAESGSGLYFETGLSARNVRRAMNTILFENPGASNDDNIVAESGPSGFIVDISNSFLGARVQNPIGTIAPTMSTNFIDAAGTSLVPGWTNPAGRNFKLAFASVCIDQGSDGVLTDDRIDIDDDTNNGEDLPREFFMGDEAMISSSDSTREVSVLGAGTVPPGGNIGMDEPSGTVPGKICDIGAFEYRDPAPSGPPQ